MRIIYPTAMNFITMMPAQWTMDMDMAERATK